MKKSYHSIMVPTAEAKITRHRLDGETCCVSIAGELAN
jgi:hypothetical protein